ncbi:MAG: SGNH/GDSL hydrolase family protein, partial [Halarsenatibacteraceae bacterium]
SLLGRWLNNPVINLGFSGKGKMEVALAELISEIEAKLYVIDCLPNMLPDLVKERAEEFLFTLLNKRPEVPVVLIEDRTYTNSWIIPSLKKRNRKSRKILKGIYNKFRNRGVDRLHYIRGESLLGSDAEAAVDGSHPSDLGFYRFAENLRDTLQSILNDCNS